MILTQKRQLILLFGIFLMTGTALAQQENNSNIGMDSVIVDAPFEMPPITIPDFSAAPRLPITDFGAQPGDKESTTRAIDEAIAQAHAAGGGIVVIPAGEWLTGKIHLKSNVNLHVEEHAVLNFSEDPQDYLPPVHTTWEGMEAYNYSPLIYAFECHNVAITGKGKLHARLDVWRDWYDRPEPHMAALARLYHMAAKGVPVEERQMVGNQAHLRPQFIQFNRCENVLMTDVSISSSPFWVIHPYLSKNVVIRGVNVQAHGHNNDGVDIEMSQNVLVENSTFDQGDDAIAIKSGRNQDAWRLNTPSKNIVVRNSLIRNGHQLLAIGSELSGGVENVLIENCQLDKEIDDVMHLLFIKTNERRGGYVDNIHMRNITAGELRYGVLGIETDVLYQWRDLVPTYERRLTPIRNVHLENIRTGSVDYISQIKGNAEQPVQSVSLIDVEVDSVRGERFTNSNVDHFSFTKNE
ncbi:Pectate lyase superfamily protein [Gracilimonas mengyeensis]|uniref:Pectate lyase superfamily protein n=2 Tax=Gracilimonas mengyeensis TaxID=1302730 RepID=A0A521BTW9_9BACT|nr:Pectate lyase superfamily protein [Gracilimonas mengyeensis]